MIASSCARSIRNPYFSDFWETMTWVMNKPSPARSTPMRRWST
jgi:hypothetical protein